MSARALALGAGAGRVVQLALLLSLVAADARALDVEVDSDAQFQAYEVRTPGASALLARRRFVANLGLRLVQELGDPEPDGRQIRLSIGARLRLYTDFGEDCLLGSALCVRATDASAPSGFQPLADGSIADLPMTWLAVDGLPLGISARLGRQTEVDPIGFTRFDGLSMRIAPWTFLSLETMGGAIVRATSIAGSPAFEPNGSIRIEMSDSERERFAWAAPVSTTWMGGAALRGGLGRQLELAATFRQMWEDDGQGGESLVMRRAALAASSTPIDELRLDAYAVLDLRDMTFVRLLGRAALDLGRGQLHASVEREVPRFDPGTIWAWFNTAPVDQLRIGGSYELAPDLTLGGNLRGRRAELGERGEDFDAGFDVWSSLYVEGFRVGLSGFAWSGALGPLAGVSLDASRRIIAELGLEAHVTLWHFDDPLRAQVSGPVVSEALAGVVDVTPQAQVRLEAQHAYADHIGHRFRGIISLRVDTWR